ncbi:hypothetical protein [Endozoicomonas sp. Mp262]|uniref:hypothetical protein n=1 Tax=Endozoicomonas sp. Mp262 TaxID=2919499 RepID=UPI0021D95C18
MSGSYGVNFLNTNGEKTISEEYVNISVDKIYKFASTAVYEKTYKLSDAVLFAVSKGSGGAVIKYDFDANTQSIKYKIIVTPFSGTKNGEFRIYRKIPLTKKSSYGVIVRNGKSEPVFSSEHEVLNITDLVNIEGIVLDKNGNIIEVNDSLFIYAPNHLPQNWSLDYCKKKIEERGYIYVAGDSSDSASKHRMLPSFKFPRVLKGDYCVFNTMPISPVSATGENGLHDDCPYAPFIGLSMDNRLQVKAAYPDNILQDIGSMSWIHFLWFIFSATAKIPIGTSLSSL